MKDGKGKRNEKRVSSIELITAKCSLSGKRLLPEIATKKDVAVRLRGKKRINTCIVLKSALEEILGGPLPRSALIETSKEDFEKTWVSYVLPVENLSTIQKSILGKKFSREYKRVFY